jgi:hypothetical protein
VRRHPGLRRWRTFDSVNGSGNRTNGHGGAQARSLSITEIADQIIAELRGCNVIAIGPTVIGDGITTPSYYCAVCAADSGGFFTLIVGAEDLDDAMRTRVTVRDKLRDLGRCVLSFDSELKMAREVSQLWPGPATAAVLATIEDGR